MTGTQVFLRFVKSEYTNKDGTLKPLLLRVWRKEIMNNFITSKQVQRIPRKRVRISKNYVDDYLTRGGFSLGGYMGHFVKGRTSMFGWCYGFTSEEMKSNLIGKWRNFLKMHIEGDINRYWIRGRKFEFKWKD